MSDKNMEAPEVVGECKISTNEKENNCTEQKQQERKMQVRSIQVDGDELIRLVRDEAMALPDLKIAVSGLAGRFPKSESLDEFEWNLREGRDMINDQDNSRFSCGLWNLPPRAGRLKDLTRFDYEFFGYPLDHANYIDFQLRILYEVVYESILDAGLNPANLRGTKTGVFFGLHCNEFENAMCDDPSYRPVGYYAQFAVKIAQYFDFRGLTLTFDAACASGFVGLHNAVESLRDGIVEQAIVCSANIPIHPTGSFIFYQMQMLSPTGYSRFLDSRADGYVKSEACVSVVLQRKHLARRNYASIMATMTSVDGYKPEGITFPSDKSQEELIRAAKEMANLSTNHIEYLEAHGTGTPAGDPQEASAISNVYFPPDATPTAENNEQACPAREQRTIGPLLVGSVKTNMGHSEAASGLCALVKVALMFEHELIYKNLHFDQPNTNIEALMDGRLKFVDELQPLRSKIIPMSCYGFGGANVHAICRASERETLAEALGNDAGAGKHQVVSLSTGGIARLVVMFGRTEAQLNHFFDKLLEVEPEPEVAQHRRPNYCLTDDFLSLIDSLSENKIDRLMRFRGFALIDCATSGGAQQLARSIKRCELAPRNPGPEVVDIGRRAHLQEHAPRPVHLVLPGLGCEWTGMGAGLADFRLFWSTIERLARVLEQRDVQLNLEEMLKTGTISGAEDSPAGGTSSLCRTFVAIVAYEIALINLVRDYLKVNHLTSIVGHSLGEISCAYAARSLDERETILVAYELGRTLDEHKELISGKMVALLGLPWQELEQLVEEYQRECARRKTTKKRTVISTIRVSCINGPESITVSGRREEVDQLFEWLMNDRAQIGAQLIVHEVNSEVALHNEFIMNQSNIRQKLREALERVLTREQEPGAYDRTHSGWVSSFLRAESYSNQLLARRANVDYFVEMLCRKVDFRHALDQLDSSSIVYELGPVNLFESQIIQMYESSGQQAKQRKQRFTYVRTMQRWIEASKQTARLLQSFGELYQAGATFNLAHFYALQSGSELSFPVRRQTPSVSSLFKWDHSASLFVPRYPVQFSKSSAKSEMPIDLVDRDKYLLDHCIEGRVLHPATGYLFLIWRIFSFTKRKIYDACFQDIESELVPVEFHNVRLLRAIILGSARQGQMYVHYEEATGKFEVKEGGSVVCEGYAFSPQENSNGLLYEDVRAQIRAQNVEMELSKDDVYKQFRVCGYDYGDKFRCIETASSCGRVCRVKFNGYFVCLTDSILQSIFLTIARYAPPGTLFLPTGFSYARFQPEPILSKIRAAKMALDLSDGSLNTKAKREMMNKIMQRESDAGKGQHEVVGEEQPEVVEQPESDEPKPECIFETFCDPVTGVIITDGIEMRGIKASPAPRRTDNTSDVLLESYQFVADEETPICDEQLTRFDQTVRPYVEVCNSMSVELYEKMTSKKLDADRTLPEEEIQTYMNDHLECLYEVDTRVQEEEEELKEGEGESKKVYDIRRNGSRTLLSLLDQLLSKKLNNLEEIRQRVQENRTHLMKDLITQSYVSERTMRPLVETVIENVCLRKSKLRMIEVNLDDGILRPHLHELMTQIEPTLQLDYALGHPDPNRLHGSAVATTSTSSSTAPATSVNRTLTLKTIGSFFADNQLRNLDFVVYKDASCYATTGGLAELEANSSSQAQLSSLLKSLCDSVRRGAYFMLMLRHELTLAERILIALTTSDRQSWDCLNQLNEQLSTRCELLLEEAHKMTARCRLVARKSDSSGCSVLLFRRLEVYVEEETELAADGQAVHLEIDQPPEPQQPALLLRVRHDELSWMDELKRNFQLGAESSIESSELSSSKSSSGETTTTTTTAALAVSKSDEQQPEVKSEPRKTWLIAALTRESPVSGLVGMMQALRKELGTTYLRCFYDAHTFKHCHDEEVDLDRIAQSAHFREALERDQVWNCVDEQTGKLGSFRHLTINEALAYGDCLCASQKALMRALQPEPEPEVSDDQAIRGAYVSQTTRGDLSSFTWFEAPFAYLHESEDERDGRGALVRVAYSALNFRDIMLATGRLPLDALPMRLAMADCLMGLEFSGWEVATGKRVMGMVYGRGIATHILCPRQNAIKLEIPEGLSMAEAATIPVVYATAVMALLYRGQAKRGESVLIHAGSGGVGQAAIRLAYHLGLEVFTTVGSQEKRDFLLAEFRNEQLQDDHIFNSRTCEFEERIFWATRGRGVDLVLNSLAEDKLQASLNCLADGGRFLEIGKYDLTMNTRMELLKLDYNKTFHGILLDKLFDTDDMTGAFERQLRLVLDTLQRGLKEGFVQPIKYTTFAHNQVEQAFRFMATGKHVGKVLIEIDGSEVAHQPNRKLALSCVPRFQLSARCSYVVTGGLGGFGLELCKWLVARGARFLVLTSRRGLKTGYQRATLARLQEGEAQVKVRIVTESEADASQLEGARHLCDMAREFAPDKRVGGVFHLAMVLKDTLIENMSHEDFLQVCQPKLEACVALDGATRQLKLDYFVAFSSITSGKGNAGQANYAYANSALERVCEQRRRAGHHGLAIQWGAIGDVGVAFENLGGNDVVIGGTVPQRMPSCMATLEKLLCASFPVCLSVVPVKRGGADGSGERGDLVAAIFNVLGIKDPSKVSEDSTLGDLGLDSLMAVEIRQYIEREYDMTLNIQEIRALTIARIREINDQEKPSAGASGKSQVSKPLPVEKKEVASYGTQAAAAAAQKPEVKASAEPPAVRQIAAKPEVPIKSLVEKAKTMNETRNKMHLNKELGFTNFVPALELPEADFCKLNHKDSRTGNRKLSLTGSANSQQDAKRPIFFLPPIYGSFELLELICAQIERPCVGLNWTAKLGRAQSVDEAVSVYLKLLSSADWSREFDFGGGDGQMLMNSSSTGNKALMEHVNGDDATGAAGERVVDLVGYSFGATIAFELMRAIHVGAREPQNGDATARLLPGRLILLDGSPKQIEMGSQFLANLTGGGGEDQSSGKRGHKFELEQKVDELLMVYLVANVRQVMSANDDDGDRDESARLPAINVDFLSLQRELKRRRKLESKVRFASRKLVLALSRIEHLRKQNARMSTAPAEQTAKRRSRAERAAAIELAMEAYLRRYELITNYQARSKLPVGCTLIRAEKMYLQATDEGARTYNEDLDLGSICEGQVELHVMSGNHETFLNDNRTQIGTLITRACRTAPSTATPVVSIAQSLAAAAAAADDEQPNETTTDDMLRNTEQLVDGRPVGALNGAELGA